MTEVEELIQKYKPLAVSIARRTAQCNGAPLDDTVADALIGLWHAAETYDPTKCKFTTWARKKIGWAITDGWRATNGRTRDVVRPKFVPLDVHIEADVTFADLLVDDNDSLTQWWDEVERAEGRAEDAARLEPVLASIDSIVRNPRDREIIRAHIDGQTQFAIAEEFGLTNARVSQIWRKWVRNVVQSEAAAA
jgi:RNA polymerase sigma factor (sigma-70 family)